MSNFGQSALLRQLLLPPVAAVRAPHGDKITTGPPITLITNLTRSGMQNRCPHPRRPRRCLSADKRITHGRDPFCKTGSLPETGRGVWPSGGRVKDIRPKASFGKGHGLLQAAIQEAGFRRVFFADASVVRRPFVSLVCEIMLQKLQYLHGWIIPCKNQPRTPAASLLGRRSPVL